jgi:DNA-binding response OmpR family regulator
MARIPVVLVVEDEESVQTTLCATLTVMGFKTHIADTVDAALKVLGTEHIDAVSLDIRLPDPKGLKRTGLSLLAFLRATAEYANVPVLIFTGMPLSSEDEQLARRHDAHIFYKPQRYSVLIEHLNRMLESTPAA